MSDDDEFDNIPDDFAGIVDVDWSTILDQRPPQPRNPSTHYSGEDDDDLDPAFFAELHTLEQSLTQARPAGPSRPTALHRPITHAHERGAASMTAGHVLPPQSNSRIPVQMSRFFENSDSARPVPLSPHPAHLPKPSTELENRTVSHTFPKRARSKSVSPQHLLTKKGKSRHEENEGVRHLLSTFEDELTCPICCDIFVAAHLGNPCGHSICGDCGWQWTTKNKNGGCAVCRTELSKITPMIPNIAIDNTVEKYIQFLGFSGNEAWIPGGTKHTEWSSRKEKWKKDVARRTKKITPKGKNRRVMEMINVQEFVDWTWMVPEDGASDEDYEESDEAESSTHRTTRRRTRRNSTRGRRGH